MPGIGRNPWFRGVRKKDVAADRPLFGPKIGVILGSAATSFFRGRFYEFLPILLENRPRKKTLLLTACFFGPKLDTADRSEKGVLVETYVI